MVLLPTRSRRCVASSGPKPFPACTSHSKITLQAILQPGQSTSPATILDYTHAAQLGLAAEGCTPHAVGDRCRGVPQKEGQIVELRRHDIVCTECKSWGHQTPYGKEQQHEISCSKTAATRRTEGDCDKLPDGSPCMMCQLQSWPCAACRRSQ